tara:strand:+ start:1303 stop:1695 length:393 start_codon:yes stop_codon:yes gene_type:complete
MASEMDTNFLALNESDRAFLLARLSYISRSSDSRFGKFLYRSKAHFLITCVVACEREGVDFETIFRKYNKQISLFSRSTVQSILNSGVLENFYVKIENSNDRRRKNYFLSPSSVLNFQKDIENLRKSLSL